MANTQAIERLSPKGKKPRKRARGKATTEDDRYRDLAGDALVDVLGYWRGELAGRKPARRRDEAAKRIVDVVRELRQLDKRIAGAAPGPTAGDPAPAPSGGAPAEWQRRLEEQRRLVEACAPEPGSEEGGGDVQPDGAAEDPE